MKKSDITFSGSNPDSAIGFVFISVVKYICYVLNKLQYIIHNLSVISLCRLIPSFCTIHGQTLGAPRSL